MIASTLTVTLVKWIITNPDEVLRISKEVAKGLSGIYSKIQGLFETGLNEEFLNRLYSTQEDVVKYLTELEKELGTLPEPLRDILLQLRAFAERGVTKFSESDVKQILENIYYVLRFSQEFLSEATKNRAQIAVSNVIGRIESGEKGTPING